MNQKTYNALGKWAAGKSPVLAQFGPLIAFAAEALHLMLTSKQGRELLDRCAARDEFCFDSYYQSQNSLFRALPPKFLGMTPEKIDAFASQADSLPPGELAALAQSLRKPPRLAESMHQFGGIDEANLHETLKMLADDQWTVTSEKQVNEFSENSAFCFVMRLVIPGFVRYRSTPQVMCGKAVRTDQPDLDHLNRLVDLDPPLMQSKIVKPILYECDRATMTQRHRIATASLHKPLTPPTCKEVKHRLAGFISYLGHLLGQSLTGPEIKELFDIRTWHQDSGNLVDQDLPVGESLRKMLSRERKRWEKEYHPEIAFAPTVRALQGDAA